VSLWEGELEFGASLWDAHTAYEYQDGAGNVTSEAAVTSVPGSSGSLDNRTTNYSYVLD